MFHALIVKPIFNLLVLIYTFLPGHNFGLAIIIFTILIRLLMWPLIKKQLHQARAMRELQPEIKKIKAATKGDKQKESLMMMALYKEKEISPFGSIGTLLIQVIVLIGLYQGLRKVIVNPQAIIDSSYPWLQHTSWLKALATDIHKFDSSLFGLVDLKRAARGPSGIYWPAMFIVLGSAVAQFFQSKQLLPNDKEARGLKSILKEAGSGKKAEQGEVNAAVGRSTRYFFPVFIFLFTVGIPSALSLYWLTSGVVAYLQQAKILSQDTKEMKAPVSTTKSSSKVIEGEVVSVGKKRNKSKSSKRKSKK